MDPETWRWVWLAFAVGGVVGEIATAGTFFLFPFGLGAAVACLLAFLGVDVGLQWVAFLVVSVAALAATRPIARRLDRAGPGSVGEGSITGLFTVLVDGDDHDEPVADTVRGILDGHVVMSRRIAERGRYPAIDLLKSVSRTLPHCLPPHDNALRLEARRILSTYADMEELIRLGAYRPGSSPEVDEAIALNGPFERFLGQGKEEATRLSEGYAQLRSILGVPETGR